MAELVRPSDNDLVEEEDFTPSAPPASFVMPAETIQHVSIPQQQQVVYRVLTTPQLVPEKNTKIVQPKDERAEYPMLDSIRQIKPLEKNTIEQEQQQVINYVMNKEDELDENKLPAYIIHQRNADDTLSSLSIAYGVTIQAIKQRNGIFCDDLDFFDKSEVIIPFPTIRVAKNVTIVDIRSEQQRKEFVVGVFRKVKQVCEEEAHYYLSLHDFDFAKAVQEYEEDIAWEKQQGEKKAKKLAKKRTKTRQAQDVIASTFGMCIPGLRAIRPTASNKHDQYADLELDEIDELL